MSTYTTPTWGYKIISDSLINFYHVLLPKIDLNHLTRSLPQAKDIKKHRDGSISVSLKPATSSSVVIHKILSFFDEKSSSFLETPNYYYKVTPQIRQKLKNWALSFEGCLALLLKYDPETQLVMNQDWQFVNSPVGGLHLSPYTLFLYADHSKIIHPITVQNYENRKKIEQAATRIIKNIFLNLQKAESGLEGVSLLRMVEKKTNLSRKEICGIINEKSFGIKTPHNSTFFTG